MQVDRVEDIPSVLDIISECYAIENRSNKRTYFDRVEPAESCECDEKHQSACDPFCEWVTFGGNRAVLRDRA